MVIQCKNIDGRYTVLVDYGGGMYRYSDFLSHWQSVPSWKPGAGTPESPRSGVLRFYIYDGKRHEEGEGPAKASWKVMGNADNCSLGREIMDGGEVGVILDPIEVFDRQGSGPQEHGLDLTLVLVALGALVVGVLLGCCCRRKKPAAG